MKITPACLYLLLFFLLPVAVMGQNKKPLDPDEFLSGKEKQPKILLVGSWHFNYPGLDAHVTEEKNRINIYSPKRQQELAELLDYIARFKPTKIMVESGANTGYLLYNYREWKAGRENLSASERSQIGLRLMERLQLDTLYGVDDWPLLVQLHYDSVLGGIPYLRDIYERHYFGGKDSIQQRYAAFYDYEEKYEAGHTLLEGFRYLNSDKVLNRYFGAYITGGQFISDEKEGPDALSMFWINRNLRIFRNIQKIKTNGNDRILVIFGAGHVAILKWLFECSPGYELVKFGDL